MTWAVIRWWGNAYNPRNSDGDLYLVPWPECGVSGRVELIAEHDDYEDGRWDLLCRLGAR